MSKVSKITIESNDPDLVVDINKKSDLSIDDKSLAFCLLLSLFLIIQGFYVIFLTF